MASKMRVPVRLWYLSTFRRELEYPPFVSKGKEVHRPLRTKYEVGDVIVVRGESLGVVLGCIDVHGAELRTCSDGMVSLSDLTHATPYDVSKLDSTSYLKKYAQQV